LIKLEYRRYEPLFRLRLNGKLSSCYTLRLYLRTLGKLEEKGGILPDNEEFFVIHDRKPGDILGTHSRKGNEHVNN
jgi:hypothetical protein